MRRCAACSPFNLAGFTASSRSMPSVRRRASAGDPVFRARFSEATGGYECVRLLVAEAGRRAEASEAEPGAIDAYVDQARGTFETLALAGIEAALRKRRAGIVYCARSARPLHPRPRDLSASSVPRCVARQRRALAAPAPWGVLSMTAPSQRRGYFDALHAANPDPRSSSRTLPVGARGRLFDRRVDRASGAPPRPPAGDRCLRGRACGGGGMLRASQERFLRTISGSPATRPCFSCTGLARRPVTRYQAVDILVAALNRPLATLRHGTADYRLDVLAPARSTR